MRPTIACYYFPNYHVDPFNEQEHGPGWTEWELVKAATPRFPGHHQPRVPALGYRDESDPREAARSIDLAADHGIDAFIVDWYWYKQRSYLSGCIERGLLKAPNAKRMKFALMWANHDWIDIHPALSDRHPLLYPGAVDAAEFDRICDYVIEHYMRHPSYWCVDGKPYFSIYETFRFIQGLGGMAQARAAIDRFRAKLVAAGFKGLHLNLVVWGVSILPGETVAPDPRSMVAGLGADSVTSYVWVHHVQLPTFPCTPYNVAARSYLDWTAQHRNDYGVPYHPNVTVGWDSSPRTIQSNRYVNRGYPHMAVLGDTTPANFAKALRDAAALCDPRDPVLTVNSWNEWTEGSYLEPDTTHGTGHLEAIRATFNVRAPPPG